jgi:hypothetical protein
MENKYLIKIAAKVGRLAKVTKAVGEYWGNVTGKNLKHKQTYLDHVTHFQKSRRTVGDLRRDVAKAQTSTNNAQIATGAVGVAGLAGAGYGYKKYKDKQKADILRQYQLFYKSAAVKINAGTRDAAKTVAKDVWNTATRGVGRIGGGIVRTFQTAGNRQTRLFARKIGVPTGSRMEEKVMNMDPHEKAHFLSGHARKQTSNWSKPKGNRKAVYTGPSDSNIRHNIATGQRQATHAKVAIGATAVAGAAGIHAMRKKDDTEQKYY